MGKRLLLILLWLLPHVTHSATPKPKPEDDELLLSSARAAIGKGDVDAYMQKLPEQDRILFLTDGKRINSVLESLYLNRALANEARKMKLDADPLVKHQIKLQEDQFLARLRLEKLQKDTVLPDFAARALEIYKIEA